MTKALDKWQQVSSNEQFQSFDDAKKIEIRDRFFDRFIAPKTPEDKLNPVRDRFNEISGLGNMSDQQWFANKQSKAARDAGQDPIPMYGPDDTGTLKENPNRHGNLWGAFPKYNDQGEKTYAGALGTVGDVAKPQMMGQIKSMSGWAKGAQHDYDVTEEAFAYVKSVKENPKGPEATQLRNLGVDVEGLANLQTEGMRGKFEALAYLERTAPWKQLVTTLNNKGSEKLDQHDALIQSAEKEQKYVQSQLGDVDKWSGVGITQNAGAAITNMLASVGLSFVNPSLGGALIGTQVFGDTYTDGISKDLSRNDAAARALVFAAAEGVTERVPLGVLTEAGTGFWKRIFKSSAAEAIQEPLVEAIQMGYDKGILNDDITFEEAIDRLAYAGLLGGIVGGTMAVPSSGVSSMIERSRLPRPGSDSPGTTDATGNPADMAPGQDAPMSPATSSNLTGAPVEAMDRPDGVTMDEVFEEPEQSAPGFAYGENNMPDISNLNYAPAQPGQSYDSQTPTGSNILDIQRRVDEQVIPDDVPIAWNPRPQPTEAPIEAQRQPYDLAMPPVLIDRAEAPGPEDQNNALMPGMDSQGYPQSNLFSHPVPNDPVALSAPEPIPEGVSQDSPMLDGNGNMVPVQEQQKPPEQIPVAEPETPGVMEEAQPTNDYPGGVVPTDEWDKSVIKARAYAKDLIDAGLVDGEALQPHWRTKAALVPALKAEIAKINDPAKSDTASNPLPQDDAPSVFGESSGNPGQVESSQEEQSKDSPEYTPTSDIDKTKEKVLGEDKLIYTPSNTPVTVSGLAIVELDDLVVSNHADGSVNKDYPKEYQPRDRSRSASRSQVSKIAANLNPKRLGESQDTATGAPIVSQDRIVESGNGRVMAIEMAYSADNISNAKAYMDWIESLGFITEGFRNPVLVRTRKTEMTKDERVAFVRESNESSSAEMSATENSAKDSEIVIRHLSLLDSGDITSPSNASFVRSFVGDLSESEVGPMMTSGGMLSQRGRYRIEAAILMAAYNDKKIVSEVFENADSDIKSLGNALLDAAPQWAKMREEDNFDVTGNLLEAVGIVQKSKAQGVPASNFLDSDDMFSGEVSALTKDIVESIYKPGLKSLKSRKAIGDWLKGYANISSNTAPSGGLFGDTVSESDIIDAVNKNIGGKKETAPAESKIKKAERKVSKGKKKALDDLKKLLEGRHGTMSSGVDPELMVAIAKVGGYSVAEGAVKFASFVEDVILSTRQMGIPDKYVIPQLKKSYSSINAEPEEYGVTEDQADEMEIGKQLRAMDVDQIIEGIEDVERGPGDQESDSGDRQDAVEDSEAGVSDEGPGQVGPDNDGNSREDGDTGIFDQSVDNSGAFASGERSNIGTEEDAPGPDASSTGNTDSGGSTRGGSRGVSSGRGRSGRTGESDRKGSRKSLNRKGRKKGDKLGSKPKKTKAADRDQIASRMPFLLDGQVDDIVFADNRLGKDDGYGVLFTNGTGTGKTFTGLGILRRALDSGKKNALIIAPSQNVIKQWVDAGKDFFDINIHRLKNIKDSVEGVIITTHENFRENIRLLNIKYDMLIVDEAHKLSSAEDGKKTMSLKMARAVSNKNDYDTAYLNAGARIPDVYDQVVKKRREIKKLQKSIKPDSTSAYRTATESKIRNLKSEIQPLASQIQELVPEEQAKLQDMQGKDRARAVFLSATPFAYEKSVTWANEFLFDWGTAESQSYNGGDAYQRFMMQHFGYRMKTGKLNEPDASVDRGLMQRQFNTWLKKEGALSFRGMESEFDYDRKFVMNESRIGTAVDDAFNWLRDEASIARNNEDPARQSALEAIYARIDRRFNYQSRMYFLEAIKADQAPDLIRKHLALGRKVLVLHDFKKGGISNPFLFNSDVLDMDFATRFPDFDFEGLRNEIYDKFSAITKAFDTLPSPIERLKSEFPDIAIYNGKVTPNQKIKIQEKFNSEGEGSIDVILAQNEAIREGVSLHDTTGKHQRVEIQLGLPSRPVATIQLEGRIFRTGQKSNAMFRYMTIGTNWERFAFASKISERASAAENLAVGEGARGLKDAIINGYSEADVYEPGFEGEGTGGKEFDAAANNEITRWDQAKSHYYGTRRQGSGRSAQGREQSEFFATPEPVGLKMVDFLDLKDNERVLEPSAGHGAIARWFPEGTKNRAIEYTNDLSSQLSLRFDGEVTTGDFMDHNRVNKYEGIAMNPPFGSGGKQAAEHVEKAYDHLVEGGRLVALIPTGPAADKKFQKLLFDDANGLETTRNAHIVAEIAMPRVTFERAGTSVSTRILVIDKMPRVKRGETSTYPMAPTRSLDYTSAESINDLFDQMEDLSIDGRWRAPEEQLQPVAQPSEDSDIKVWTHTHTRTNEEMLMAKVDKRLEREDYLKVAQVAKDNGGRWNPTAKGFHFKTEEGRSEFVAEMESTKDSRSELTKDDQKAVWGDLREALDNYGLTDVSLELNNLGVAGRWNPVKKLITIAQNAASPNWVLDHEVIHALKDAGLFKPGEWSVLSKAAAKSHLDDVKKKYPDLDAEAQLEEAVANHFADRNKKVGIVQRAINKIKSMIDALKSVMGMPNVSKIYSDIDSGSLGSRERTESGNTDTKDARVEDQTVEEVGVNINRVMEASDRNLLQRAKDGLLSNKITEAAKRQMLGALTLRQVSEVYQKAQPKVKRYVDVVDKMIKMRNHDASESAEIVEGWQKWASKNRKDAEKLHDMMHESTLYEADPSYEYQDRTPQLEGMKRSLDRKMADLDSESPEYRMLSSEMSVLDQKIADEPNRKAKHEELSEVWDSLPEEATDIYDQVREHYKDKHNEFKTLMRKKIEDAMEDGNQAKAMRQLLDIQFKIKEISGPYFPLARFGEYWVDFKDDNNERVFMTFETSAEQKNAIKELNHQGVEHTSGMLTDPKGHKGSELGFVRDVMGSIDSMVPEGAGATDIKDMVFQMYLKNLPERSMMRNRIHRKGVKGFNKSAIRAFGDAMAKNAYQMARLAHSDELNNLMDGMEKDAKKGGVDKPRVYNEMIKRHEWVMNPGNSGVANMVTSAGFIYMLSTSPAAAGVNLSQSFLIGVPVMSAELKVGMTKAAATLVKNSRKFKWLKGRMNEDLMTEDEKKAMEYWIDIGLIDTTGSHQLLGIAENGGFQYSDKSEKVMKFMGGMFHRAEQFNREVTALSTYQLARNQGKSHKKAMEMAAKVTWEAHFDYGNHNRARFMQGDVAKVAFQFKQYSQSMTYFLMRNFNEGLRSGNWKSDEAKSARKKLLGAVGLTGLVGGVSAMPLWVVFAIANAAFDDEDEPYDARTEFNAWLAESFGKDAADTIMYGVGGASVSGRISLDGLWYRSPNRDMEASQAYDKALHQLAGPVIGGILPNLARGATYLNRGEYQKAFERASPKFLRDFSKAQRYWTEGEMSRTGAPIKTADEFSFMDIAAQAMGFSDADVIKQYNENNAIGNYSSKIKRRRKFLLNRYFAAWSSGDRDALKDVMKSIEKFNKSHQGRRGVVISQSGLRRSLMMKYRIKHSSHGGMNINKSMRFLVEDLDLTGG